MASKFTFTCLFWCLFVTTSIAQSVTQDSPAVYSSLKARKYKVVLGNRKIMVAHTLDSLKGNVLYISRNKQQHKVSLEIVKALLVAKKKRPVARGLGLGAITGVALGAFIGYVSYQRPDPNAYFAIDLGPGVSAGGGAAAGALMGMLSGTLVGAGSNRFTHYDFSTVPLSERADLMRSILQGR